VRRRQCIDIKRASHDILVSFDTAADQTVAGGFIVRGDGHA
jgi:hypothetical protein